MISTKDAATIERIAIFAFVAAIVGVYQGVSKPLAGLSQILLLVAFLAYLFSQIAIRLQWIQAIERLLVLLMLIGLLGMFQPWNIIYYEYGFYVLITSTCAFIIVSHLPTPK